MGLGLATLALAAGLCLAAPRPAPGEDLERLKRDYYLAQEEDRPAVLGRLRSLGTDEALAFNLELLTYPDLKVRVEAAESLASWGRRGLEAVFRAMDLPEVNWIAETVFAEQSGQAVPFLLETLQDPSPRRRARAAYLLGVIGDASAFAPLSGMLKDPSREVRLQVIQALAELGNPEALVPILNMLEDQDAGLSEFVVKAAERFGPKAGHVLEAALESRRERVRSGAALALGRLRLPSSIPRLVRALDDPALSVRRSAAIALGSYHDMAAAEGLLKAMADSDQETQEYATSGLAALAPEVVPALVQRLRSPSAHVRRGALVALRKARDGSAIASIIQALDDPDPGVRMFAITTLYELKDPRAIKPLIHRLKVERNLAWLVSYAFMQFGDQAVDELLSASGGDESFCYTRNTVLLQMGNQAIETLIGRALKETGSNRHDAVVILGDLRNPAGVPALVSLLGDREVGWVAANSLARIGRPSWEALVEAARGGDGPARQRALEGISLLEDPEALGELVLALGDEDPGLRAACAAALVRAGQRAVLPVAAILDRLPEPLAEEAAEVLCRIEDMAAIDELERVLFPQRWETAPPVSSRLADLRQAYLRKGSLEPVRDRLRDEMGRAGGGSPWERVLP